MAQVTVDRAPLDPLLQECGIDLARAELERVARLPAPPEDLRRVWSQLAAALAVETPASRADRKETPAWRPDRVEQFVRERFPFVWRLARHFGLSAADADEVAQDTMLIAARRLNDIEPGRELAFLYPTTCHVIRRAQERRGQRCEDATADLSDRAATQPGSDELLEQRQAHDEFCRILARIPEELRMVLVLFEIEGWSQAEISETLGLAQGTVASRIRRGRARFADLVARSSRAGGGTRDQ